MKQHLQSVRRSRPGSSPRDIVLVVGARALSVAGDAAAMIALLLRSHDWGLGPLAVTAVLASFGLPLVVLMGVAGRIADRCDSRRLLVVGASLQALMALALSFADSLIATCVLVIALQSVFAVQQPTWAALVPRLAGEERAGRVIALQQGASAVASPIGAAVGGVMVGGWGDRVAFWVDAATFAVLAVAAAAVRTRRGGRDDAAIAGAVAGVGRPRALGLLFGDGVLRPLFLALGPLVVALEAVNVVEVFLARDVLGAPAELYGLLALALGVGGVVGSFVASRIETSRRRILAVHWSFALMGALTIGSGLAPTYAVLLALQLLCGAGNAVSNGCLMALVVARVPDAHRGAVNAALNGYARALGTLALLLGGWLGAAVGARGTLVTVGVVSAACVVGAWPGVRRAVVEGSYA